MYCLVSLKYNLINFLRVASKFFQRWTTGAALISFPDRDPITSRNRRAGESKLKIKEMGSHYLFVRLYCWLEKYFSRDDYRALSRFPERRAIRRARFRVGFGRLEGVIDSQGRHLCAKEQPEYVVCTCARNDSPL